MKQVEVKALAPCCPATQGAPHCEESRAIWGAWEHRSFLVILAFLPFLKHTNLFATPDFCFYRLQITYYRLHCTIQGSSQVPPPPRGLS